MSITVTRAGEQLTEEQINNVERELGRSIPFSYRLFLLEHNGGYPEPSEFSIVDAGTGRTIEVAVRRFFGIGTAEETFNLDYAISMFGDRLPHGIFPIARDPGGSLICIATEGPDAGKVYFWDHEEESDEGEVPTGRNLYLVADDFEGFLDKLS